MFRNLKAEMVRKRVSKKEMAALIGVSYNTICNKIKGKQKFFYDEACKIREHFFPELSLEYLFETENQIAQQGGKSKNSKAKEQLHLKISISIKRILEEMKKQKSSEAGDSDARKALKALDEGVVSSQRTEC